MSIDKDSFLKGLAIVVQRLLNYPGMTQEQFEHQTRISQATVSKILAKDYQDFPKIRVLNLLADFMGIELSELIRQIELNSSSDVDQESIEKINNKVISQVPLLSKQQALKVAYVAINHCLEDMP